MTFGSHDGTVALLEASVGTGVGAVNLAALLPEFNLVQTRSRTTANQLFAIAAQSASRRHSRLQERAATSGIPFAALEPGLLRPPPGWGRPRPVLSATARITGPASPADVLDAGRLLATRDWLGPELLNRAALARRDIASRRLAGRWWNAGLDADLPAGGRALALIVAAEGGGSGANFEPSPTHLHAMLAAALLEYAPGDIAILAPDAAKWRDPLHGFLKAAASRGCIVLSRPVDPWLAIERAACIYTTGGETGFLALLAGRMVRCFAGCFYSGWGVTADQPGVPQNPFPRTIDELFAGACLVSTRCIDPYHNALSSFEEVVEILDEWRKIATTNRRIIACLGMSFWKRRQVGDFLRSSAGSPVFRRSANAAIAVARARPGGAVAVWASRAPAGLAEAAERQGVSLIRVEDGFVRSVGLGSDFMPPASLVLDSRGMHFDPSVRSDLERLLLETDFGAALLNRARALIARLVVGGVTKYNLGEQTPSVDWPGGTRRILVPGQVEDDLSVRLGGEGVRGNLDLLARVRRANPDAFILYKPHPDVDAGHRKGKIPDDVARRFADIVIRGVSTAALLDKIDELHTLTSLAGFEALLRRRRVVVYGRPFYAGWGLTTDLTGINRGRLLSLEELVAGALILYPRYLDPVTRLPCGPEVIIERLGVPKLWRPGPLVVARRLQGVLTRRWSEVSGKFAGGFPAGRDHSRTPQL